MKCEKDAYDVNVYAYDICISHDDSKLFYVGQKNRREIFVVNSNDGTHIRTLDTLGYELQTICISQDDKLFCVCKDGDITVMDVFGTHLRMIDVSRNLGQARPTKIRVSQDRIFALCRQQNFGYLFEHFYAEFHQDDGEHVQTQVINNKKNKQTFISE
jgi:hypothetical protein